MRIKAQDPTSGQTGGTIYDPFKVSFVYLCASDALSITIANNILDQAYTFNQAALALPTPVITHTAGCAMTFKLFAYFDVNDAWEDHADASSPLASFVSGFNPSTGVASISCTGVGTAPTSGLAWKAKTVVPMRITATSTYSRSAQSSVSDDFTLTLSDTCGGNQLALDSISYPNVNGGAAVSNFNYHIDDAAVSKQPAVSAKVSMVSCPITAKLYIFRPTDNTWIDQTVPDGTYSWIQSFTSSTGTLVVY